jgi:hypothetical protein
MGADGEMSQAFGLRFGDYPFRDYLVGDYP